MKKIKVSGKVSDFHNNPLEGADVYFYDGSFERLYELKTDLNGEFVIEIENKVYPSVFICKDYKEKNLEYWHWNYIPEENDFLDVKIDGLEIYGMKAWETRPTYPGMMIFFRPMSLKKFKAVGEPTKDAPILIAPDLESQDIQVQIDSKITRVMGINRVKEFITEEQHLDAYLIHVSLENIGETPKRVILTLQDRHTFEKGMAALDLR